MRDRVERLRVWIVVGTALVVLAVAGFLGYARYRSHAFLAGLPRRLGAEISRETNGYTYSQTIQGRTIFTLHAAKMEQRKDGVVRLHDVGVVLYGRKADRADRIYGNEFEYDQSKGVVRAIGVVHMDLQAPAPVEGGGKKQRTVSVTGGELAGSDPRVIHVMTSGLVYLTNLGVAATGEDIEFSEGSFTGRAHGADYSSDTGVIVLQSAVRVNGLTGGGPMVLTAERAELNQAELTAVFARAQVLTAGETVNAARAVVHVRKDGSPERMEGSGQVVVTRPEGGRVTAEQAEVALNAAGKAQDARLWGGVQYVGDDAGRREEGSAVEARVRFDAAGMAQYVTAIGNARMTEREDGAKGKSLRVLTARVVEASLGAGAKARSTELRDASATGDARLVVVSEAAGGTTRTEMVGDTLTARVVGGRRVSNVVGTGHTVLHQVNGAGVDERSAGDRTELIFRTSRATGGGDGEGIEDLVSAVQDGHVSMSRQGIRRQGTVMVPTQEKGTAERAVYSAETNVVTMLGGVVLANSESTLWAAKVAIDRGTGDSTAEGGVRMTYVQIPVAGSAAKERESVHVLATRAGLRGGSDFGQRGWDRRALFYGVPGHLARMWQGTSQVEAPVIELEDGARRLTASGTGEGMQVQTVLVETARAAVGGKKESGPSVVRIMSREMVYTDGVREVVFRGGVVVDNAQVRMKAQTATVYLQMAKAGAERAAGATDLFSSGTVERMVATGKVEIDQPGRRGIGEQLTYTASDGLFVLTGTLGVPPRMVDAEKGMVTGGTLRFHSGDDSVDVTSEGIQSAGGTKRRTQTRVKQ